MANRVATAGDVTTYSTWCRENLPDGYRLEAGAWLVDTYTDAVNKRVIFTANEMAAATVTRIYLLSDTFDDDISEFKINASGGMADNVVVIPLNGQVRFRRQNTETANQCFNWDDIPNFTIYGELFKDYPGLLKTGSVSLYDFGFVIDDNELDDNVRMLAGESDNQSATVIGVGIARGFAGIRVARTNDNSNYTVRLRNCMIVDGQGEGTYIGQTNDNAANPVITKVEIEDILIINRANEGFQIQDLATTAGSGYIKNLTVVNPACGFENQFQNNQDYGIQVDCLQGDITVEKFIIVGGAQSGMQLFSDDKTARSYNPTGRLTIKDGVIDKTRNYGVRVNGAFDDGPRLDIRNISFVDPTEDYSDIGKTVEDYWVNSASTATIRLNGNTYHSDKTNFNNPGGTNTNLFDWGNTQDDTEPTVSFIDERFKLSGTEVRRWAVASSYNSSGVYQGQDLGDVITYLVGDVVFDDKDNETFRFWYCNTQHASNTANSRPTEDATNSYWDPVTWDSSGYPSYHVSHNSGDTQTNHYWGDYRLQSGSKYYNNGYGIKDVNQQNGYTKIRWYIAKDNGSNSPDTANSREIPGEHTLDFDTNVYEFIDSGDHIRVGVQTIDKNGTSGALTYSSWSQIP